MGIRVSLNAYLEHLAKIATSFPFSVAIQFAEDASTAPGFIVSQGQSAADYYSGIAINGNTNKYAWSRHPGESNTANQTAAPHPIQTAYTLIVAVFTDANNRKVYCGTATPTVASAYNISRTVASDDRVYIGAIKYNGAAASLFSKGSVAENAWWSSALADADVTQLLTGVAPETVQSGSFIDVFPLHQWRSDGAYPSLNGRTMTASGAGITTSAVPHPVAARGATTVLYANDLVGLADGALAGWTTAAGAGLSVALASTYSLLPVAGTKVYYKNSAGDSSVYTALGVLSDQAIRIAQKIPAIAVGNAQHAMGLLLRNTIGTNGYRLMVEGSAGATALVLKIVKYDSGTTTLVTSGSTVSPSPTDTVHLEFRATGVATTTLEARIWLNDDARPSSPTLSTTNASALAFQTGYPGIYKNGTFGNAGCGNIVIGDGSSSLGQFYVPSTTITGLVGAATAAGSTATVSEPATTTITGTVGAATAAGSLATITQTGTTTITGIAAVALGAGGTATVASRIMTDNIVNQNGEVLANTPVVWTWTPSGRIGSMTGLTPVDGTGTTDSLGRLATGITRVGGKLDVAVRNGNVTLDDVYQESFA